MKFQSKKHLQDAFSYHWRYLVIGVILFLITPGETISQRPGIINEEGDTISFVAIFPEFYEVCVGDCAQFVYLPPGVLPSVWILDPNNISWYLKGGIPDRSNERDPYVCFPEFKPSDTIQVSQRYYDTVNMRYQWGGSGTTRFRLIYCPPEAIYDSDRRLICVGEYITYRDSSKRAPVEWLWEFEGGEPSTWSGQEPPPIFYAAPGFYETRLWVGNESGEDSLYVEEYIEVMDRTSVESSYKSEVTVDFGEELFLFPCYRGDEYQWFPEEGLSCTDCATPRLTAGHVDEYTVIMGIEGSDCRDTCSVRVNVRPVEEKIWFPNVFSPNDDGYNDFFFGIAENIVVEELRIFNRWGQEVFRSEGFPEWNGRDMSGQPVDQGVYVYMAIIRRLYSRESGVVTGDVTVLR